MTGSRRPPLHAQKCFVWIRDSDGVLLHGLPVDGRGDEREHAARAWLHLLRHSLRDVILTEAAVFEVLADGRRSTVSLERLREWLVLPGGSPREVGLRSDLRQAQGTDESL